MDFLSVEYVAEQAKDEISALECSWEHHHQGEIASYVELAEAGRTNLFDTSTDFCACCVLFGSCSKCPLSGIAGDPHEVCCEGLFKKVSDIWCSITIKHDYSNENFKAFQEAEGKLCTYIAGVLERKKAEQAKPKKCENCENWEKGKNNPCFNCELFKHFKPKESKPALRHGDYGEDGHLTHSPLFVVVMKTKIGKDVPLEFVYGDGSRCPVDDRNIIWHGNYIDDLARNAEDLEEFEMCDSNGTSEISCRLAKNDIEIRITHNHSACAIVTFDQATEIHQKLGQMLAFARRKQAQKGAKDE